MKTCTKCGVDKSLQEFKERKSSKDGLHTQCRSCLALYYVAHYEKNKEKKQIARAARYEATKDALKENARLYRAKNKAAIKDKGQKYREANIDKILEANKKWREANREYMNQKRSEWQRNNKGAVCEIRARRRASEVMATPKWSSRTDLRKIYDVAAKMRQDGLDVHVDHIVPLQGVTVCGLHVHWNLQIIRADQNRSKGNRIPP